MNCPNCKNPVQENATECEWCGSVVPQLNNYNNNLTGSFIDNIGNYVCGDIEDIYFQKLLENISSDFKNSDFILRNIEQKCPNCSVWGVHFCYGKYQCSACGHNYIYNK
jgi:hypothetical protein